MQSPINYSSKIYVAGHKGMAGSAIVRQLKQEGFKNIITAQRSELDLSDQSNVRFFFKENKLDCVVLAAAKVGGIQANNDYPAEFIYQNLAIQSNVIFESYKSGIKNLLFLGSACIYPKNSDQPMVESDLLSGKLESTNEPYAIAKIAGIKLCESFNRQYGTDYRSVMPTNLYGPNDNFHKENSHVLPAFIRRFHEAKINDLKNVSIWGTGTPKREFLHVHDMASACVHIMKIPQEKFKEYINPMVSHINVGGNNEVSIKELAELVKSIVGYKGNLLFDHSKPDGVERKFLDSSILSSLGWHYKINLEDGIKQTYEWYCNRL